MVVIIVNINVKKSVQIVFMGYVNHVFNLTFLISRNKDV